MKRLLRSSALTLSLVSLCAAVGYARGTHSDDEGCEANHGWDDNRASYAETREQRLAASSTNYVNPGQNGSIRVHGWNNSDVLVKACIQTAASTDAEAQQMASEVTIADGPGQIEAHGPSSHNHRYWNVSYEVWVPNASNLKLEAYNGSVAVENVRGQIRVHTLNGSVRLNDVNGDIEGSTTNGSLNVDLAGNGWTGSGLKLTTTNGSVRLNLPQNFSARVEASTVNGSVHTDFPITISGDIGKHLNFTLGSGGPLVEATTVNGSVHISRRA